MRIAAVSFSRTRTSLSYQRRVLEDAENSRFLNMNWDTATAWLLTTAIYRSFSPAFSLRTVFDDLINVELADKVG